MRALSEAASDIVEIGPSAPLGAFFKREGILTSAVTTAETAAEAAEAAKAAKDSSTLASPA